MGRLAPLAVALALIALLAGGAPAGAASCAYPSIYPGDAAPRDQIAGWMAGAAADAGIPAPLPVMASLTDTGLQNVQSGDADSVGYFQMRTAIWDSGEYAGFPEHPTLQLQWFVDHAIAIRQQRIAQGIATYGQDESGWGVWAADVQQPAEQYRGRYQLKLDEAKTLAAAGCVPQTQQPAQPDPQPTPGGGTPAPEAPRDPDALLIPDSVLPALQVNARKVQNAARTGALGATARCTNENCLLRAAATIAVPGKGLFKLRADPRNVKKGKREQFRLTLGKRVKRLAKATLRKGDCPIAAIRVVAANAGGYRASLQRTVLIAPRARACG